MPFSMSCSAAKISNTQRIRSAQLREACSGGPCFLQPRSAPAGRGGRGARGSIGGLALQAHGFADEAAASAGAWRYARRRSMSSIGWRGSLATPCRPKQVVPCWRGSSARCIGDWQSNEPFAGAPVATCRHGSESRDLAVEDRETGTPVEPIRDRFPVPDLDRTVSTLGRYRSSSFGEAVADAARTASREFCCSSTS